MELTSSENDVWPPTATLIVLGQTAVLLSLLALYYFPIIVRYPKIPTPATKDTINKAIVSSWFPVPHHTIFRDQPLILGSDMSPWRKLY